MTQIGKARFCVFVFKQMKKMRRRKKQGEDVRKGKENKNPAQVRRREKDSKQTGNQTFIVSF